MAFSADGKRIVSGSGDKTVKVWDADKGQEVLTLVGHTKMVNSVAFSADGKRHRQRQRGRDGEGVGRGQGPGGPAPSRDTPAQSGSVAFSADGKRIVSGGGELVVSRDGKMQVTPCEVKMWEADKGQEVLTLKGHTRPVYSVAFSADGKRIVSGSEDNTVKVWDAATGQEVLTIKGGKWPRSIQRRRQTHRQRQR